MSDYDSSIILSLIESLSPLLRPDILIIVNNS